MIENNRAAQHCFERIYTLDSFNISALHYLEVINAYDAPDMALDCTNRLTALPFNGKQRKYQ